MADTFQEIYVYMDHTDKASSFLGTLFVSNVRGKSTCAFSYDDKWLYENKAGISLDPDLSFYRSRQYVPAGKAIFGMFGDSCPDRWGRMLMDRREVIKARKEARRPRKLTGFDYLLEVYDE